MLIATGSKIMASQLHYNTMRMFGGPPQLGGVGLRFVCGEQGDFIRRVSNDLQARTYGEGQFTDPYVSPTTVQRVKIALALEQKVQRKAYLSTLGRKHHQPNQNDFWG